MYCGINVVRRVYGLGFVRGSIPLNRSSLMKADAVRRCGFSHTPCGMAFSRTFKQAGYLPARAFGEISESPTRAATCSAATGSRSG